MCGIAGLISLRPFSDLDFDVEGGLSSALSSIAHRGPDDEGKWIDPTSHIMFGHRRLSIIDLSTGHQPMSDTSGEYTIVFNGEIYNFVELRDELEKRGHVFWTRSDTEVLLESYKEWGLDCLDRLNGMFSFALWDNKKQSLVAARDPFGEKGFYYAMGRDRFMFASEPKALLHLGMPKSFNAAVLSDYFSFRAVPAPHTLFLGISKLEAGYSLTVDKFLGLTKKRFWDWRSESGDENPQALEEELIERLSNSVRIRLRSDVPVACFLSGGVDSSLVTALMAHNNQAADHIKTFSVTVDDESINEQPYQRIVSEKYKTEHFTKNVGADDMLRLLDRWYYYCDDLVADPAAVALHSLSNLVRENGFKVVLSGEGADELFGGYGSYGGHVAQERRKALLNLMGPMRKSAYLAYPFIGKRRRKLMALLEDDLRFGGTSNIFSEREKSRLIANYSWQTKKAYWAGNDMSRRDPLNEMLQFDLTFRLPDDIFVRTDRATMASSIETRVPFVDPSFARWAMGVHGNLKLKDGITKYVLKRAAEKFLPREVLYRKKIGFDLPVRQWLRGKLNPMLYESIFVDKRVPGINYAACQKLYRRWKSMSDTPAPETGMLWYVFALEMWHREWFR